MIGRSLIIFQRGNNQNELHTVSPWELALAHREKDFDKKIIKQAKRKKWKPEEIVSDTEVEAIVNSTHCADPKEPGYHHWASDGVHVINLSGDPNLPNPAAVKNEKMEAEAKMRRAAFERIDEFIPELIKLRQVVPEGSVEVKVVVPLTISVRYSVSNFLNMRVLREDGHDRMWAHEVIDQKAIEQIPELEAVVNCPYRKAYRDRCQEIAESLGLDESDIENATYFVISDLKKASQPNIL